MKNQNTNSSITNDGLESEMQDVYSHVLMLAKNYAIRGDIQMELNERMKRKKKIDKSLNIAIAKLTQWSPNITKCENNYKDNFDYEKNVINVRYYIRKKITHYLHEIEEWIEIWTNEITEVAETSDEFGGIENECKDLISNVHDKCDQAHANLVYDIDKKIFENYPPKNIDWSQIDSSDKEEKQKEVQEFLHIMGWVLQLVYNYAIESVISLRDKLIKAYLQEYNIYNTIKMEDIFYYDFTTVQYLNHPIPKPYTTYQEMLRKKELIVCKCGKECNVNNVKKHLSHQAVNCANQLFTIGEICSLVIRVDIYRKNLDVQSKRNFRQSEQFHLQVKKEQLQKRVEDFVNKSITFKGAYNRYKYFFILQDIEDSLFELIQTETRQNMVWIKFWQKKLLALLSNSSKRKNISKIIENCLYNNNRANEQIRHILHNDIFDYLLSSHRTINSDYCDCGSVSHTYTPGCSRFPDYEGVGGPEYYSDSKENRFLKFFFKNHSECRDIKAIQNTIREMIYYISWKNQNVQDFTIRQVMSIKTKIEKENDSIGDISFSYDLAKLKKPVPKALRKIDWGDVNKELDIHICSWIPEIEWSEYLKNHHFHSKFKKSSSLTEEM